MQQLTECKSQIIIINGNRIISYEVDSTEEILLLINEFLLNLLLVDNKYTIDSAITISKNLNTKKQLSLIDQFHTLISLCSVSGYKLKLAKSSNELVLSCINETEGSVNTIVCLGCNEDLINQIYLNPITRKKNILIAKM
jgi:hypothetical protein